MGEAGPVVVDLVPHLDAGDRRRWIGDQNARPLSELGQRQAAALAAALAVEPVDALYSSPALRCRQSLAPLAERLGMKVLVLDGLRETYGFAEPREWTSGAFGPVAESLGGAYAAGRGWAALHEMLAVPRGGRVIACSHGDLIPALVAFLVGAFAVEPPTPMSRRGSWYRLRWEDDRVAIAFHDVPSGFPL